MVSPRVDGVCGHYLAKELDLVARGFGVTAGRLDNVQCTMPLFSVDIASVLNPPRKASQTERHVLAIADEPDGRKVTPSIMKADVSKGSKR